MSIGVVALLFHFFVVCSSCIEHDLGAFGMASRVSPIGECFCWCISYRGYRSRACDRMATLG
jgi:hypothetical protein